MKCTDCGHPMRANGECTGHVASFALFVCLTPRCGFTSGTRR